MLFLMAKCRVEFLQHISDFHSTILASIRGLGGISLNKHGFGLDSASLRLVKSKLRTAICDSLKRFPKNW
jgi:hypothetical protein